MFNFLMEIMEVEKEKVEVFSYEDATEKLMQILEQGIGELVMWTTEMTNPSISKEDREKLRHMMRAYSKFKALMLELARRQDAFEVQVKALDKKLDKIIEAISDSERKIRVITSEGDKEILRKIGTLSE